MSLDAEPIETIRQIRLRADRRSPHHARAFVKDALESWGHASLTSDATLVVSELISNAVIHAHSSASLTLLNLDDGIQIRVEDDEPTPPEIRWINEESTGGRGLHIVDALSDDWGVEASPPGKIVWLDIREHAPSGTKKTTTRGTRRTNKT